MKALEATSRGGWTGAPASRVITRIVMLLALFALLLGAGVPRAQAATTITFTAEELLGKPTDTSIAINIVPAAQIEYHYQYGVTPGVYDFQTPNVTAAAGQPSEITLAGLTANTRYYYRMRYHAVGDSQSDWVTRTEHSFWTQRAAASTFAFTVTSDSHENWTTAEQNAMTNILNERPDFSIDLGDSFLLDGLTTQTAVNNKYLAYREPLYFDKIGSSVPLFLSSGNHEDEEGWNLDDSFSIARASIQARKLYYPTPIDDGFYSANTDILAAIDAGTYGDQYREDYYAWEWGDALFVVIDPFQYTMHNPYGATAGETSDDPKTCDYTNDTNCQWNWTLGAQQYQWLEQTLENSQARYKFVFSHHMLGGKLSVDSASTPGYVRGGCEGAPYFEWGGKNADGTDGFAARRSAVYGADARPIRELLMANGVSAYFHGHDHQYVYETCDGMVYQEVPSPGMAASGFSDYTEGNHGAYNTVKILPNSGHLLITVTPSQATVDYISASSTSGTVTYSYTIAPNTPAVTHELTVEADPAAGGATTPAAGSHAIVENSVVNVTASAAVGYAFDHWSGACTGSSACSITMDEDKTVTAHFVAVPIVNLTVAVAPAGGGTTSPAAGVHSYSQGATVNLTASPAAGYAFDHWSGACTGPGTCSVTMDGNQTVTAHFTAVAVVTLDGAVSSGTGAANAASMSFAHTTGAGANRLLLVGVSWNSGSTAQTISSVTFTPSGGSAVALSPVITQQAGAQLRYAAIYSLVNPPGGQAGTVAVTFSGAVSNGIVAGAANFAGVDPGTPLGTAAGAGSTSQGTTPTVTLTGLAGDELVFDALFMGASTDTQTVTAGAGQTQRWNAFVSNTRGAASTAQATGSSVAMSWTAGTSAYWAIAAAPINPAPVATTYDLTVAADPADGGTTNPAIGVHSYAQGATADLTASPAAGYAFDHWSGACTGVGACSVVMDGDKTVTAHFLAAPVVSDIPDQTIAEGASFVSIALDGYVTDPDDADTELTWTASGATDLIVGIVDRVATITAPTTEWNGTETITLKATDPGGLFDDDAAAFTVTAVNDPPAITGQTLLSTPKDAPLTILLANLVVTDLDDAYPADFTLTVLAGNHYTVNGATITPAAGYVGPLTVPVRVNDGTADSAAYDLVVTVTGDGGAPVLPSSFWGEIHYQSGTDGPEAGDVMYAYLDEQVDPIVSATVGAVAELLIYTINVPAYPDGALPETVTFVIDGRVVAKAAWATGANVHLDIHPPKADTGGPYVFPVAQGSVALAGTAQDWGNDANTFKWDLNHDGLYDESAVANPTFTFSTAGAYPIALEVTDAQGATAAAASDVIAVRLDGLTGQVFDGQPHGVTVVGVASPYTYDVTYDGSATPPTAAGSYEVEVQVRQNSAVVGIIGGTLVITGQQCTVNLVVGWNLVSCHLKPVDTDVADVLSSLDGNYDLVYAWDATGGHSGAGNWLRYDPTAGFGNSLETLNDTQGFWIHMTAADTLEVYGSYAATTAISLSDNAGGWNLIGYPSASGTALPAALAGIAGQYKLVITYHANDAADLWKLYDPAAPDYVNDLKQMAPGWGYWIFVNQDATLNVAH